MSSLKLLWAAVILAQLGCRAPSISRVPAAERAFLGCWRMAEPIFRGLPIDTAFNNPPWSVVELTVAQIGRYGTLRVLGVPGRPVVDTFSTPYRLHGWRPVSPDSVEIWWTIPPNAMEVLLALRGDSATGEYFYHGNLLAPGENHEDLRRPPVPMSAVRVSCSIVQAG